MQTKGSTEKGSAFVSLILISQIIKKALVTVASWMGWNQPLLLLFYLFLFVFAAAGWC